jgi:hypothetical protein
MKTNPNEDIHLGIHQIVLVHSNGKFLLPDNYSGNILIGACMITCNISFPSPVIPIFILRMMQKVK